MGNSVAPSGHFDASALYTSDIPSNHSLPSPAGHYLDNAMLS